MLLPLLTVSMEEGPALTMADLYKNDAGTRNFIHKAAALPGADPGGGGGGGGGIGWLATPPLGVQSP